MPQDEAEALALRALVAILEDERKAERLLTLSGLTPDQLRSGLTDRAVLAAVLDFLAAHEPDLVAVAGAMDCPPETIVAAQRSLSR